MAGLIVKGQYYLSGNDFGDNITDMWENHHLNGTYGD